MVITPSCACASPPVRAAPPVVFLTREAGKNTKLHRALQARHVSTRELPAVAQVPVEGGARLPAALADGPWAWVIVTSPEAASVVAPAWKEAHEPSLRLASVGAATAAALAAGGLESSFEPSKATGKCLAAELPLGEGDCQRVLYPASARAATTVPAGLAGRGFEVTRLDCYTTIDADWTRDETDLARGAEYVAFASPSAVHAWAARAGTHATALCIGETSSKAAEEAGFARAPCPSKPGLDAWAALIAATLEEDGRLPGQAEPPAIADSRRAAA